MKANIKKKWIKLGLSKKIILVGVLSLSIMLTISLFTGIVFVQRIVRINMEKTAEQSNHIVEDKLVQLCVNVEQGTDMVISSDTLQKKFNQDNRIEQMRQKYILTCLINNLIKNSQNADIAILYHRSGNVITSNSIKLSQKKMEDLDAAMKNPEVSSGWLSMHPREYCIFSTEKNAVSYYKKITSIYSGEVIGIIQVDVSENAIAKCYEESPGTKVFIVDEKGQIISSSDKTKIYKQLDALGKTERDGTFVDNGKKRYRQVQTKMENGWTILRLEESRNVLETALPEIKIMLLVNVLTLLLTAIAVFLSIRRLMRPIDSMIDIMNNPEDSIYLNQKALPAGDDEIGRLVHSFRTMQNRLRILIERIKFEENQKTKQEMVALQANIKPHFLYNTLESVCALIQMERKQDAILMLKSIEGFYRGTLSNGQHIITIREELLLTERYVQIQKLKYAGNLSVEMKFSEEVMEALIPKLTLQPIVENAIYHGLKNRNAEGKIVLWETHDAQTIRICVEDNGEGFAEKQSSSTVRRKQGEGYAISNVVSRLKLCFGAEYNLEIDSKPGCGTRVYIKIPMTR